MDALDRLRRSRAVARELPASPSQRAQSEAIVDAVDNASGLDATGLAGWLLRQQPALASALSLAAVPRILAAATSVNVASSAASPPTPPPPSRAAAEPPPLPPPPPPHLAATISFNGLRRARTTLADFSRFYLAYHGLARDDFFRWLPLLVFVEASIYQLDEDNEELASRCATAAPPPGGATEAAMLGVLEHHGLLDAHVRSELADGREYWELERRLCAAMGRRAAEDAAAAHDGASVVAAAAEEGADEEGGGRGNGNGNGEKEEEEEDEEEEEGGGFLAQVLRAHELKSFDYRLLHAMLRQLCGAADGANAGAGDGAGHGACDGAGDGACDGAGDGAGDDDAKGGAEDEQGDEQGGQAALLRFVRVDEVLTDLADDLYDYEKDVERNSFNVLRGYCHALGVTRAPLALAARIGALEAEHERLLRQLPAPTRDAYRANRRAAMAEDGGERWEMPPRLLAPREELAYRRELEAIAAAAAPSDGEEEEEAEEEEEEEEEAGHRKAKRRRSGA